MNNKAAFNIKVIVSAVIFVMAALIITACGKEKPVAIFDLEQSDIRIDVGKSEKVHFSRAGAVDKEQKVIFTSSDESVATVDSEGLVKGISEGTCTITVTYGDSKGECRVVVSKVADADAESTSGGD